MLAQCRRLRVPENILFRRVMTSAATDASQILDTLGIASRSQPPGVLARAVAPQRNILTSPKSEPTSFPYSV
jgi:hypothetical protein